MVSPLGAALSLSQPMVSPAKAQIAPTDVLGAYNSSVNQANTQYLAKLQQQNALWGGLAGLGGSALTAGILKGNLFSPAATAASTVAGGAAPAAAGTASAVAPGFAGGPLAGLAPPDAAATSELAGAIPSAATYDSAALPAYASSLLAPDAAAAGTADVAGTVGADLAATAAPVAADAAVDAGGMTLADLLPFLFA